jgi:nuclear pore complex protein Nup188
MEGAFRRSNRSYADLYTQLSNPNHTYPPDLVLEPLKLCKVQLTHVTDPFERPSDASKKEIETGNVTLPVRVGDVNKTYVFAIRERYQIDEVQALIPMRASFYNSGMPDVSDSKEAASELAGAIGNFYLL